MLAACDKNQPSVETVTFIDCRVLKIGQYDRDESHSGQRRVTLVGEDQVQIGGQADGIVFRLPDLLRAVEILGGSR